MLLTLFVTLDAVHACRVMELLTVVVFSQHELAFTRDAEKVVRQTVRLKRAEPLEEIIRLNEERGVVVKGFRILRSVLRLEENVTIYVVGHKPARSFSIDQ